MFEGLFQLVHKVADKEIKMLLQPGTEIIHIKEALLQFIGYIVQYEKDQIASQATAQTPISPLESSAPVVAPEVNP